MKALDTFREISRDPYEYARQWKKRTGGRVVGYFCSYTVEEVIHAAGALPFRIFGTRGSITLAESHLQSYCCSLVRGGLEDVLAGNLEFLDGTVFPHTCDSIQRLSDIWRLNAGIPVHIDIILPVMMKGASARNYMSGVIRTFHRDLGKALGVDIDGKALGDAIALANRVRASLGELYRIRSDNPSALSGSDLWTVIRSAMVMDRRELEGLLQDLIAEVTNTAPGRGNWKRLVLAGGVCTHPDIYSIVENAGAAVVWDELCTGTRYFEGPVPETGDPLEALATRYFERITCPAKHRSIEERGHNLVEIVKAHDARGVIFLLLKFCDPHSFDYPYMKERLDAESIPSMLLELEEQPLPEGQLRTRFESFIEML